MKNSSFLFLLLCQTLTAQNPSIEAIGLAELDARCTILNNPAQEGSQRGEISQSLLYNPQLSELYTSSTFGEYSKNGKNYALLLQHFGPEHYQNTLVQLAFGLQIYRTFGIGISVSGSREKVVEQNAQRFLAYGLHWDYHPKNSLHWAGSFQQSGLSEAKYSFKQQLIYNASKALTLLGGFSLESQRGSYLSLATEYALFDFLRLRQGIRYAEHLDYRAGMGLSFGDWEFQVSFQWQLALGQQEGISICYKW